MRAGSGRNSARATASPMSIVPKEVNITIVTLSSTLDDILGTCGERSLGALYSRLFSKN